MRIPAFVHLFWLISATLTDFPAVAQQVDSNKVTPFTRQMQQLDSVATISDSSQRETAITSLWTELINKQQVPFVSGDSVAFLYKGSVHSVSWQGDFNGWGSWAGGYIYNNQGYRVGKTNIWRMKAAFPRNARVDYKIVLNGREWVTDPANPHQQWGGSGPNSELRMPDWKPEVATIYKKESAPGSLTQNAELSSKNLGYALNYRVYTPASYAQLSNLPVIYVTDGQEYADERMGAMIHVLDNLIAEKKINPVIAVFIDPREVRDHHNRRMTELSLNDPFVAFLTKELVPYVDKHYRTKPDADARAILGTSLGGLNAAYVGAKASGTFRLIGIHSPAFWYRPQIYTLYEQAPTLPLRVFMSTGIISDTEEGARRMKAILSRKKYNLQYVEVNEGHSWGNWRALIDDALLFFFANPTR